MNTKHLILSQAEDLARQGGYDGFSFADLAAGAGIRKASVHHHFATKATLSTELAAHYTKRTLAALHASDGKPAGDRMNVALDLYRAALDGGRSQCLCVAFSAVLDRLPKATQAVIADYQSDVRDWLTSVFEDAARDGTISQLTDPAQDAAATFALLEGAQLVARASRDVSQFDFATAPLRARIQTGATR